MLIEMKKFQCGALTTSRNYNNCVDIKKMRSKKVDFWGFWDPEKRAIFGRFSDFLGFFPNVILTKNDDFGGTMIPPSWFLDLGHFWPFLTFFGHFWPSSKNSVFE